MKAPVYVALTTAFFMGKIEALNVQDAAVINQNKKQHALAQAKSRAKAKARG
jgi:hypothetical protein